MDIPSDHPISAIYPGKTSGRHGDARAFTLVEIMIVVVIIGILASMAYPYYKRIHTKTQDAAVINNVRQLSAAANQYFLERGVETVSFNQLVGSSNYVKTFDLVAKESYPTVFTNGSPITVSNIAGSRTITYDP